jgi:undecaprenyl diphosphate synthase
MQENFGLNCLGFIMDGNRRWAKAQGLEKMKGHVEGFETFKLAVNWAREKNIPHIVFYAFSTENWKRTEKEVGHLMELFENVLQKLLNQSEEDLKKEGSKEVRVRIVGRRQDFSPKLQILMTEIEAKTADHLGTTVWLALSYGGRAEIVEAVNQAVKAGETVTEESFEKMLWTAELPDPDMIVRTSGEHRLSNFLTWKAVYSELYFIDKHWPALTKVDFEDILEEYGKRERRRGV